MLDTETIRPFLEDHHLELAERVGAFCGAQIASLPEPDGDAAARLQAREILDRLGSGGWCRYAVPARYGGVIEQVDLRSCCLIREALAAASPLADAIFALQCLGSMPIALAGGEALKARWLPEVATGRAMAAFAMTEMAAGSDIRSMETRARHVDGGIVLDGRKTFISNAGLADVYTVFAVTEPGTDTPRGVSCFVVAGDAPGIGFGGAQVMSSPHPLGEVVFEDCRIDADSQLGADTEGLKIGLATLDRLRATVAAAACGMASRALAEGLAHARARRQFDRPLSGFQLIQQKLARSATDLDASRLLTYRAAAAADRGASGVTYASAVAKAYATEAAQRIVDDAVQILGGRGVLASHPVDRLYRSVRALRIYEGTTEIQQLVIARELLKSP